jgi:hypothetical protein
MSRQTSIQLTGATERQAEALKAQGFGTFTDIVRLAIDRMYQQEVANMSHHYLTGEEISGADVVKLPDGTLGIVITPAADRSLIEWYQGESIQRDWFSNSDLVLDHSPKRELTRQ